jgi:hypothetical protein
MSPIDHLNQWEETMQVAGLLTARDIKIPSASLQVEWFDITFHKNGHAEYVQSRQKLHDKMLQTLASTFGQFTRLVKATAVYNATSLSRFELMQSVKYTMNWRSSMHASCAVLLTSAGATGPTHNVTTAIIVNTTVNVSTPSFAMVVDTTTRSKATRRVSLNRRTRTSNPATSTASAPTTHMTSVP